MSRALRNEQLLLSAASLAIGVAVGMAVYGFLGLVELLRGLAFGHGSTDGFVHHLSTLPRWQIVAAPTVGGLVVGVLLHRFMPQQRNRGIADVQEACALHGGRMDARAGVLAALLAAVSLGGGASVGREGPAVHIGAGISAWAAARLRLSRSLSLTLIGCGAAAAVAASFNAPIAGVFFALEVVVGHYALHAFAPVVIASVAATVAARVTLGDHPAFFVPDYAIASFLELPAFALLGLVCAGVVIAFIRATAAVQSGMERLPLPSWSRPAVGGFLIGAIALYFPQVLGVGYETTDMALKQMLPLALMVALVAAKFVATAVALGSGFAGGVFSPSLFIGAVTGGAFGIIAASVFPEYGSAHGAYTIMGMGGVVAAMLGAPVSTILIVFELTGDYQVTIAVMLVATVATVVSQRLGPADSFFAWQLQRRGVDLGASVERALLATTVAGIVDRDVVILAQEAPVGVVREQLSGRRPRLLLLVDAGGALVAALGLADALHHSLVDVAGERTVGDVAQPVEAVLLEHTSLAHALRMFGAQQGEWLAVVDDETRRRPVGAVWHKDLILAHNRILLAQERAGATHG